MWWPRRVPGAAMVIPAPIPRNAGRTAGRLSGAAITMAPLVCIRASMVCKCAAKGWRRVGIGRRAEGLHIQSGWRMIVFVRPQDGQQKQRLKIPRDIFARKNETRKDPKSDV